MHNRFYESSKLKVHVRSMQILQIWSQITVNIYTVLVIIIALCCSCDIDVIWEAYYIYKLAVVYRIWIVLIALPWLHLGLMYIILNKDIIIDNILSMISYYTYPGMDYIKLSYYTSLRRQVQLRKTVINKDII